MSKENLRRCMWVDDYTQKYHDEEWGIPVHDDRLLFEMLVLESFQAGLSWVIVLKKRWVKIIKCLSGRFPKGI